MTTPTDPRASDEQIALLRSWSNQLLRADGGAGITAYAFARVLDDHKRMSDELERYRKAEPVKNGWMDCEDCNGRGAFGEPRYMGEFQPPECEPCGSCNGSGKWKLDTCASPQPTKKES